MVLGRLSNGVTFSGHVISNVIFWLFFTQKNRLDGGFPRKDLGPL
jgi:hypothetical protein